jgi:RHH-type transcriptional regulator, proline utilization regulon repressor / proline dehydrogenase / delta 1-pyrroline-5-carboxylate dehydrogenase
LNRVFGAHVVSVLTGQYDDPEGQAIYYRIPLGALRPDPEVKPAGKSDVHATSPRFDFATGLTQPFADGPASLRRLEEQGLLYGPAVNKLTLMNYTTPATVRAMEWVSALLPELPHMYLTSSRDESLDKALRLVRVTRKTAQTVISIEGNYFGHTIGTTRSLSDPATHQGGPGHFAWPRVPHPAVAGTAATIAAIRAAVAAAGGGAACYGLCYELVAERTGWVLPPDFLEALVALRRELDLPLIAVEGASHTYRSGHGAFLSSAVAAQTGLTPDVLVWWPGGQTGYVHCTTRWFVPGPLTLVSTWDGDELSLVRHHHHLRTARGLELTAPIAALDRAMSVFTEHGIATAGLGLYRVAAAGERAPAIAAHLAKLGIRPRLFPQGRLAFAPPLDQAQAASEALTSALRGAF